MGIFRGAKKVSGFIFNFKVSQWIDYDGIRGNALYLLYQLKLLFKIRQVEFEETFEEATERLELTPEELHLQAKRYLIFFYMYLLLAVLFGIYSILLIYKKNWLGFGMSTALILYALSFAFRYHFFRFQILQQKLGCTVKEWIYSFIKIVNHQNKEIV